MHTHYTQSTDWNYLRNWNNKCRNVCRFVIFNQEIKVKDRQITHLNVHQMLKHIVFSQKNAAKKKNCVETAKKRKRKKNIFFLLKN